MATSSESDAGDCRRRTPSCARRRSRSAATRSARGAAASAEPERGEAPQAGKGQRDTEAAPASGWSRRWQPVAEPSPEAAGKGRGRGRRPSQHSPSKGDKGGKGKYTFFGKGGGKSSSQRGEAPARASLSPQGRSGAKSAGKGPRESRLQEGEMLRCAWPGSAKDTFAAEGALSFADMLTTSENLSCKLELRGRERKGQGLKRILLLTGPVGTLDGLFQFIRAAARTHDPARKLPKIHHCTRAEVNVHGVVVYSLRRGTDPAPEGDNAEWLEFMKENLPEDFLQRLSVVRGCCGRGSNRGSSKRLCRAGLPTDRTGAARR
jgi:hypothetical protein